VKKPALGRVTWQGIFQANPMYLDECHRHCVGKMDIESSGVYLRPEIDYAISDDREWVTFTTDLVRPGDVIRVWFETRDVLDALADLGETP
jgi:hypothetical protein